MHKTATLILLGASWAVLAGCEQEPETFPGAAEGLPTDETPLTEPDVQIGQSDDVDPIDPVDPLEPAGGNSPSELEPSEPASDIDPIDPEANEPAGAGADLGAEEDPEPIQ